MRVRPVSLATDYRSAVTTTAGLVRNGTVSKRGGCVDRPSVAADGTPNEFVTERASDIRVSRTPPAGRAVNDGSRPLAEVLLKRTAASAHGASTILSSGTP